MLKIRENIVCFIKLGILAGGTNKGKVAMWKHVVTKPQKKKLEGQEKWELQSPAVLEGETQLSQIQVRKVHHLRSHTCGFPLAEGRKKRKPFFSHTAGRMGSSV